MNSKFEYPFQVRLTLEPVRAACLRYAKTFSKVEHGFGNKVFFQFDCEGVVLRAQDKLSLSLAQKQFMQLSKVNQIEMLTFGLDDEEYKYIIQREIKNSTKYTKCFMQLITYEAFKGISQQLRNFGYEEPIRLYEKYMKSHPKFCFLLCNESFFQTVKGDLLKLLHPKHASPTPSKNSPIVITNGTPTITRQKSDHSSNQISSSLSSTSVNKGRQNRTNRLIDCPLFLDWEPNVRSDGGCTLSV